MTSLEDDIDRFRELDKFRQYITKVILKCAADVLKNKPPPPDSDDFTSRATILAALQLASRKGLGEAKERIADLCAELQKLTLERLLKREARGTGQSTDPERIPLLISSRTLRALVRTPGEGFSRAALRCYYRIVREIYTPVAPSYVTGGVPAGEGSPPTAFITGECIFAVLDFSDMLRRTGDILAAVQSWKDSRINLTHRAIPTGWKHHEMERARQELLTVIRTNRNTLAFDATFMETMLLDPNLSDVATLRRHLIQITKNHQQNVADVLMDCAHARAAEAADIPESSMTEPEEIPARMERSASAHLQAVRMLRNSADHLEKVLTCLENDDWQGAAERLHVATIQTRRILRPAEDFVRSVMTRELAHVASDEHHHCDFPELAFAAAAYGALRYGKPQGNATETEWNDPHLLDAARLLVQRIGANGLFPIGRPIRADAYGDRLEVIGFEVLRAVAELLRNTTAVPLSPDIVRKMLRLFADTSDDAKSGWGYEHMPLALKAQQWTTSLAFTAAHAIVRMIDESLSRDILAHFETRWVDGITLANMFYVDVGLNAPPRKSVRDLASALRCHVLGVTAPTNERLWSLVLHGPPGTGKTTIPEAIAASVHAPLVEITPSDLIIGGEERVERRARIVFQALRMLTRAVILFDEFDSVLKQRDPGSNKAESVWGFLTPGMLPKLKALHDRAETNQTVYILSTNMIGDLDDAAIRDGRFDARVGIYPPDLLSRTGRLVSQFLTFNKGDADGVSLNRMAGALASSAGGGMTKLAKRGWFTAPKRDPEGNDVQLTPGSIFHYIRDKNAPPIKVKPERIRKGEPDGRTPPWRDEWNEWGVVTSWDERLTEEATWDELWSALDDPPQIP